MTPQDILKQYFGYDSFRPGQEEIIDAILRGQDALAVMPTGAGKSICYQVPAMLLPGITLVISPLISLMQDQVKALNEAGIRAAYINSSLTENQIAKALGYAAQGLYKIIYAAPERLETGLFRQFAAQAEISMVTVDESHCISQWGQDFRPSYLRIVDFIHALPRRPVLTAFTATATQEVMADILSMLELRTPRVLVTGFDRPNLYYRVEHTREKDAYILDYLRSHPTEGGIIYCATRKNVDKLHALLLREGFRAARYHAGMENAERRDAQNDFVYDRVRVIVATNAFGMGIDKSNVRFVIHYNMPQSMENYYQEAGRAGRDGNEAQCILLFSAQDVRICQMLLENKDFSGIAPEEIPVVQQRDFQRLRAMESYCRSTGCLRNAILAYFGETTGEPCGNCANCEAPFETLDVTDAAKQIINCAAETRGRFGAVVLSGILLGANRAKLREIGAPGMKTFGRLSDIPETRIREIIAQMVDQEYLTADAVYPTLSVGPRAMSLQDSCNRVIIQLRQDQLTTAPAPAKHKPTDNLTELGFQLFEVLRLLRADIAGQNNLPPYMVFSDRTLVDMCLKLPRDKAEMLNVSGVAEMKFQHYGVHFLTAIQNFLNDHPGQTVSTYAPAPARVSRAHSEKPPFFLTRQELETLSFPDMAYVVELRDILNTAADLSRCKKLFGTGITAKFEEAGYLFFDTQGKLEILHLTDQGTAAGLEAEQRVSQKGVVYYVLRIPASMQRWAAEQFAAP